MDKSDKVVLGYWAIRGLAQPIRFVLNYVGLDFVDKRYSDEQEWFAKDKPAFASKLANLPYLKDGNTTTFESDAIFYAIAAKTNRQDLVGKDLPAQVKVALARSILSDVSRSLMGLVYDKPNFEKNKVGAYEAIGQKFSIFDDILATSKWLAGDDLTYVDFKLFEFVDEINVLNPATLVPLTNILSFHTRFLEVPQNKVIINHYHKKYVESADYMSKPFNSVSHGAVI